MGINKVYKNYKISSNKNNKYAKLSMTNLICMLKTIDY